MCYAEVRWYQGTKPFPVRCQALWSRIIHPALCHPGGREAPLWTEAFAQCRPKVWRIPGLRDGGTCLFWLPQLHASWTFTPNTPGPAGTTATAEAEVLKVLGYTPHSFKHFLSACYMPSPLLDPGEQNRHHQLHQEAHPFIHIGQLPHQVSTWESGIAQ